MLRPSPIHDKRHDHGLLNSLGLCKLVNSKLSSYRPTTIHLRVSQITPKNISHNTWERNGNFPKTLKPEKMLLLQQLLIFYMNYRATHVCAAATLQNHSSETA
jgi:hypothetical protein